MLRGKEERICARAENKRLAHGKTKHRIVTANLFKRKKKLATCDDSFVFSGPTKTCFPQATNQGLAIFLYYPISLVFFLKEKKKEKLIG